jgi:hypothetical protein
MEERRSRTGSNARRLYRVAGVAALVAASACGGLVEPEPFGAPDAASRMEGTPDATAADASFDADALPLCSVDGELETASCMPPSDDLLFGAEMNISAPAGGFTAATFIGTGPWILDQEFYVQYLSSTFAVKDVFSVPGAGSPQTIEIEPAATLAGTHGMLTVIGTAGAISRTATISVEITRCIPAPKTVLCAGAECGIEPDFCGGTVSCGTCEGANAYCWQFSCIPFKPHGCGDFEAFDPMTGGCETCACGVMDNSCEDCFH